MVRAAITIPQKQIDDFCQRHHITKMAMFGSVLRDDFGPESDIDILVAFHPDYIPGLAFFRMQEELTTIFRRDVDLLTFTGISKYFRKKILREAQNVYVGI